MKKSIIICCAFITLLLTGCDMLCDKSVKTITEYIGDWTCIGQGIDKIEGFAICSTPSGASYEGDVRGHHFNGKGQLTNLSGNILDGYFYNGNMVAGKVTRRNGAALKGLRRILDEGEGIMLELGKIFIKDGNIKLGEFDNEGKLTYGMLKNGEMIWAGNFKNDLVYNGYFNTPNVCIKATNGEFKEITRTITNTVYKNNNIISTPKNLLYGELGSITNPYRVNLTIK